MQFGPSNFVFLKQHAMPCHHSLAEALHIYIGAAGIAEDRKGWLFRLAHDPPARRGGWHSRPDRQHSFRATGITAYLGNGGALEHAQTMAAHESPRTTKLYDRTKDRLTQRESGFRTIKQRFIALIRGDILFFTK